VERVLWRRLRHRQFLGLKFRRQHPVGPYVADFDCEALRLVIEVDGGQHTANATGDARRTAFLESTGLSVVRFWNNDVLENIDGVLQYLAEIVRQRQS
jgi:very-short-patch-repair endonuclease